MYNELIKEAISYAGIKDLACVMNCSSSVTGKWLRSKNRNINTDDSLIRNLRFDYDDDKQINTNDEQEDSSFDLHSLSYISSNSSDYSSGSNNYIDDS